jgi:hypothetical protein
MKKRIGSYLLAVAIAVSTMAMTGCNEQAVLADVERFAPAITDVVVVACEFTVSPLCATAGPILTAAEQRLFTIWQAYITAQANGSATPGLWNDLNAALADLVTQSQNVFALAHIVNGVHQQEVLDVADAAEGLLAVIESFLPSLPGSVPSPVPAAPGLTPSALSVAVHPGRLAAKLPKPNPKTGAYDRGWSAAWVKSWNRLPAVRSRKMQIRGLGFWASLGNGIGEAKFGG